VTAKVKGRVCAMAWLVQVCGGPGQRSANQQNHNDDDDQQAADTAANDDGTAQNG
jgi:hypothetical protein